MSTDNNTFWASIVGSPISNSGSLNVLARTALLDGSGNIFGPNVTQSNATQNVLGSSVFSESVNLGQVGILNSSIFAGLDGVITVAQLGSTTSGATNLAAGGNAYAGAVQNLNIPYSGQLPSPVGAPAFLANAGGGIINSGGYSPGASSWGSLTAGANPYAVSGGAYGASDIFLGRQGQINISVGNQVTANSSARNGSDPTGDDLGDWADALFGGTNPLGANGGSLAVAAPGNTFGLFNTSVFVGGATGATNTLASNLAGSTSANAVLGDVSGGVFTGGIGDAFAQAGLDENYADVYTAINSGGGIDVSGGLGGFTAGPMVLSFGLGTTTVSGLAGTPNNRLSVNAQAATGTGNATANAFADEFGGITQAGVLDLSGADQSTPGLQILIGGAGNVTGVANGRTNAIATTNEGSATAVTAVDQVFGIVDNNNVLNWDIGVPVFGTSNPGAGSAVLIQGAGSIAAGASIASNAYAQTLGASLDPSAALATTDNNYVVGLSQGGIVDPSGSLFPPSIASIGGVTPGVGIGGDGNLRVFADSTQDATAVSNLSVDPSGFVDPFAQSAEGDLVAGILATNVAVGGNLTSLSVASQLNAQSNAFSFGDVATARSGNGSTNVGMQDSSLFVQGNANSAYNPTISSANNYTLDPSRNQGPVNLYAGTSLITFAGTDGSGAASTATTGEGSLTAGMNESFMDVGGSATILSLAEAQLGANAGMIYPVDTNGNVFTVDGSGNSLATGAATSDATARVGEATVGGILDSKVTILGGTLTPGAGSLATEVAGGSVVNAFANAFTLGTDLSGSLADASVDLGSTGISLGVDGNAILIGNAGNVNGASLVTGGVNSQNNGALAVADADANAAIESGGIFVGSGAAINIGRNGSIVGTGQLGTAAAPYLVSANTAGAGMADATGDFDVFGIRATGTGVVSPGAQGGNVTGQAIASTGATSNSDSGLSQAVNTVSGIGISVPSGLQMGQNTIVSASSLMNNQVQALNALGTANALANTTAIAIENTPIAFSGGLGTVIANAGGISIATSGIG